MNFLKKTKSLCPKCKKVLEAELCESDGKVYINRTCPEHGYFSYLYWDDYNTWKRFDLYDKTGSGLTNPQKTVTTSTCPNDCGLCNNHHSSTLLANIDLTNRCNLDCAFCFANARACGFVYEPEFDEIKKMLELLKSEKPNPTPAVQFSGGEPTLRDDLIDIIKLAKSIGFKQVQLATNGIKIANDIKYVQQLKDSGLSTVYLHFDGVSKETNSKINLDLKAVENCRKVKLGIVLVPTIINTKNDHEIGKIIDFAIKNIEIIRGINFQPVSFTGAASNDEINRERITIPVLLDKIEEQTNGALKKRNFYPVPCVVPVSDFVEAYTGKPQIKFTAHQHCGAATYGFVKDGAITPINSMVDVDNFLNSLEELAKKLNNANAISKKMIAINGIREIYSSMKPVNNAGNSEIWNIIAKTLISHNFDALREFHWNALFIGTMHFMDNFNYDTERVSRCAIHYVTPDMTLIPFCTYNSGPVYREKVWKKFSKGSIDKKE